MPNVYHTPTIFLPRDDKRRAIQAALEPLSQVTVPADKMPLVFKPTEPKAELSQADVDEMRRLRLEDPWKWSQKQLSKKFDCSNTFVGYVIKGLAPEKAAQQKIVQEAIRSNWGGKRWVAREDREIRKDRWFRDE